MQINKIKLHNFSIYHGKNTFNFKLENQDNIILIGGENGAGKTTILEAIKLALYGSLSFGHKTNTKEYLNYIKDQLNYSVTDNNPEMSITIDLKINHKGEMKRYILQRKWQVDDKPTESFIIKHQGETLKEKEKSEFENYIRTVFPPALFNFIIFDGENVQDILYSNKFRQDLKQAASIVFNLNLTKSLKDDINTFLNRKFEKDSLSEIETEYTEVKRKYENLEKNIENKKIELENIKEKINNLTSKKEELEKEFQIHGGLVEKDIKDMKNKIKTLETKKEEYNSFLNNYYDTIFPFVFCESLLNDIKEQLNKESTYRNYINIKNKLNNGVSSQLSKEVSNSNFKITDFNDNKDKSEQLINKLINTVEKSFKPDFDTENFEFIHDLSPTSQKKLITQIEEIENCDINEIITKVKSIKDINNQINKLRKKIERNKEDIALQETLQKLHSCSKEIGQLKENKEGIKEEITLKKEKLQKLENEKKRKYSTLKQSKKKSNVPIVCDKLENVLHEYNDIQTKQKIKIVENKFLQIVNKLFSIENYIKDIKIDPNTFEIKLYSQSNDILNNLSAGEQQLVILSLLWSLVETSKREFPLVFDTLLGRIDEDHRDNIIQHLLTTTNRQIIVLATNSEIKARHYKKLKPYIQRKYLISKQDKLNHKSIIKENYFFEGDNNEVQTKNIGNG